MLFSSSLSILVLSVLGGRGQYMFAGDTSCDEMIKEYTTASSVDVTESVGDHGWQNYDGTTCDAGLSGCSNTEGKSVTKTVTLNFGIGGSFDVGKAVHAGLDFGVSVAYSTTDSQSTSTSCLASGNDTTPCVCGLQFKVTQQRAQGTFFVDNGCSKSPPKPFDVTSPVMMNGKPKTEWRTCRAATSKCDQMKNSDPCADGL